MTPGLTWEVVVDNEIFEKNCETPKVNGDPSEMPIFAFRDYAGSNMQRRTHALAARPVLRAW